MLFDAQFFFAGGDVVEADDVVGSSGGQPLAVWTEGQGEDEVGRGAEGLEDRTGVGVDEFDLAEAAGSAAANREHRAIGTEAEALRLLGDVFDPAQQGAVRRAPAGDFVIAADGEFLAVRAEGHGQHWHRARVAGRWIRLAGLGQERGQRGLGIRAIERRALLDPTLDERNLGERQRIILLRHAIIGVFRDE